MKEFLFYNFTLSIRINLGSYFCSLVQWYFQNIKHSTKKLNNSLSVIKDMQDNNLRQKKIVISVHSNDWDRTGHGQTGPIFLTT